jgi:hypothetical protein
LQESILEHTKSTGDIMKDDKWFGIRKGYIEIIILTLAAIFLLSVIVGNHASAANQSYAPLPIPASNVTPEPTPVVPMENVTTADGVEIQVPVPTPTPEVVIRRIEQGGCVVPGETIDISGIGWYTGYIAYYDRYRTLKTEGFNATKIYEVKPWLLRRYYIDPELYNDYPGNWYSHYNRDESGNSLLFNVSSNCTKPNVTPERVLTVVENKTILVTGGITVPPKYIDGVQFIVSRNTETKRGAESNRSKWWLFGNYDLKQYNIPVENESVITFTKNFTNSIPPGRYTLVIVNSGLNNITEEEYDNGSIVSPFRGVASTNIDSMSQENALISLLDRVSKSIDDSYSLMTIELQDPYLEIRQLDQGKSIDNLNTITMSGYTNTNPGDNITIEFDKGNIDRQLVPANTWTTIANAPYAPNAYRTWFKTVVFNPNDFAAGGHTLTATTGSGATMTAPVFIRKEPEESYRPPSYVQFIDNNPFVPTPTPEPAPPPVVVTVVETIVTEKIVVQEKIVPIDPYPYVIGGIVAVIVISYGIYVIARAIVRERRKKKFDINKGAL